MDSLFLRLASDDLDESCQARDSLAIALQDMAAEQVGYRLREAPSIAYFEDDLKGIALCTLVEVLEYMRGRLIDEPLPYVRRAIINEINRAILEEENPNYSASHQIASEYALKKVTFCALEEVDRQGKLARSGGSQEDMLEAVLNCCEDELDRAIVTLAAQEELTGDDIREQLRELGHHVSTSTINARRAKIKERLYDEFPELRPRNERKSNSQWTTRRAG